MGVYACFSGFQPVLILPSSSQSHYEYGFFILLVSYPASRFISIEFWQTYVEQDHVRLKFRCFFNRFQAVIGIDDHAIRLTGLDPVGNVSFIVSGDGKVLERRDAFTSKSAPLAISVDIKGVRQLTLLVDFGEDQSGQGDFADWALARIIR